MCLECWKRVCVISSTLICFANVGFLTAQEAIGWKLTESRAGVIQVQANAELLTAYHDQGFRKPILYPVNGPQQTMVMRHYPVKKGVPGEAVDHPHHKSIWFAHGDVNGVSFWDEQGEIKSIGKPVLSQDPPSIVSQHSWESDGKVIATDTTKIRFGATTQSRSLLDDGWWIDYQVSVHASEGELKLGDTKEGTFAIRTHPNLRLKNDPKQGVTTAVGHALNSAGQTDLQLWGQKATWVAYSGQIDQVDVTLVMMDHPTNLRFPTTWHAREYGLVAANPFGLSYFQKQPKGAGDFIIPKGGHLEFRYRLVISPGTLTAPQIDRLFQEFEAE